MSIKGEEELVTSDEHVEFEGLRKAAAEAKEKALEPDEKKELDKLNLKKEQAVEMTSEEKKELGKLELKAQEAVQKELTPEQYERMFVLSKLIFITPEEKKKLAKMKATDVKEMERLNVKMLVAAQKTLTLDEQRRAVELTELKGKKTLTSGEQEEAEKLDAKMAKAMQKALTPAEVVRLTKLSNLLQEKK
jgi:hypothetical protein